MESNVDSKTLYTLAVSSYDKAVLNHEQYLKYKGYSSYYYSPGGYLKDALIYYNIASDIFKKLNMMEYYSLCEEQKKLLWF